MPALRHAARTAGPARRRRCGLRPGLFLPAIDSVAKKRRREEASIAWAAGSSVYFWESVAPELVLGLAPGAGPRGGGFNSETGLLDEL